MHRVLADMVGHTVKGMATYLISSQLLCEGVRVRLEQVKALVGVRSNIEVAKMSIIAYQNEVEVGTPSLRPALQAYCKGAGQLLH